MKAMDRALTLPEIVSRIIDCTNEADAKSCATVCKTWSDIALDRIWRVRMHDYDNENTLALLRKFWDVGGDESEGDGDGDGGSSEETDAAYDDEAGVERELSAERERQDPIPEPNWDRFTFYTRKIRTLDLRPYDPYDPKSHTADDLDRLATICPTRNVFPLLRKLRFTVVPDSSGSTAYLAKYCCESLRILIVSFVHFVQTRVSTQEAVHTSKLELEKLMRGIAERSPNIEQLEVSYVTRHILDEFERSFVLLLASLKSLSRLYICNISLTPRVLACLARLPNLTRLHIGSRQHTREGSHLVAFDPQSLQIALADCIDIDPFPSLTSLDLLIRIGDIHGLLRSHPRFARLQDLTVATEDVTDDETMHALFASISRFPNLRRLQVEPLQHTGSFSLHALTPLSRLKQLTSFRLTSHMLNTMSDADLVDLVKLCPSLVDLRFLVRSSLGLGKSSFTLNALALFSRTPNQLRTLWFQVESLRRGEGVGEGELTKIEDIGTCLKGLEEFRFDSMFDGDVHLERAVVDRVKAFLGACLGEGCATEVGRRFKVKKVVEA